MYTGMRKYGVEAVFDFPVYDIDGINLDEDWVPAQADVEIMKDGGTSVLCDNTAVDEGVTYSITLTATEMQCARGVIKIQDAATKVILDAVLIFETYGNASAQHAFDLDTASQVVASVTGAVGSVTGAVGSVTGSVGSNLELGPSEVNAQMVDVLTVDTISEQTNGAPTATPTFEEALSYVYMALTNKIDVDSGFKEFYNNGGTIIWKKALTDDASNYIEANAEAGS